MYLPSSREPHPCANTPTHIWARAHINKPPTLTGAAPYTLGRTFVMINSARQRGYLLIKLRDIMCKSALLAGELILNCKLRWTRQNEFKAKLTGNQCAATFISPLELREWNKRQLFPSPVKGQREGEKEGEREHESFNSRGERDKVCAYTS